MPSAGGVRREGEIEITQAMLEGPGCLAFIDLDNMKRINDVYGHGAGDKLLMMLGSIIRNDNADQVYGERVARSQIVQSDVDDQIGDTQFNTRNAKVERNQDLDVGKNQSEGGHECSICEFSCPAAILQLHHIPPLHL